MRTYQSGTKDKKKKMSKKTLYAVLMSASIVVIALVITLSLTLGRRAPVIEAPEPTPPSIDVDVPPAITPDEPKFVSPMSDFSLGRLASLERLVYSSSMGYWRTHNGVDFMAAEGTSVMSVAAGTVTGVQHTVLEATVITVDHGDGLISRYKGLNTDVAVEVGQSVEKGTVLGSVAANMPFERDDGAHLHLEMKYNDKYVDPLNYIPDLGDK